MGHVLNNGAEQSAEIMRIVFEVGILHYDNITDLDFEAFVLPQNPKGVENGRLVVYHQDGANN